MLALIVALCLAPRKGLGKSLELHICVEQSGGLPRWVRVEGTPSEQATNLTSRARNADMLILLSYFFMEYTWSPTADKLQAQS